jgi:hypothetical protein
MYTTTGDRQNTHNKYHISAHKPVQFINETAKLHVLQIYQTQKQTTKKSEKVHSLLSVHFFGAVNLNSLAN